MLQQARPTSPPAPPRDAPALVAEALEVSSPRERAETLDRLGALVRRLARDAEVPDLCRAFMIMERHAERSGAEGLDDLLDDLAASENVVGTVIDRVSEGSCPTSVSALSAFLQSVRSTALIPLLPRCSGASALSSTLRGCAAAIMARDPDTFLSVARAEVDADRLCTALAIVGEHRVKSAEDAVLHLQGHGAARVRRAAVGASLLLRNARLLDGLMKLLDDADPNVRLEAARGLGAVRHRPASSRFAAIVEGGRLRKASLAEKRVFFDACGRIAEADAVRALDHVLNGRRKLMRREGAETRASAAHALARARTVAARSALVQAKNADDPTVRRAARRALARMVRGGHS